MGKEKNITSGEIEGMYEYISDIILKNSDGKSEENRSEER